MGNSIASQKKSKYTSYTETTILQAALRKDLVVAKYAILFGITFWLLLIIGDLYASVITNRAGVPSQVILLILEHAIILLCVVNIEHLQRSSPLIRLVGVSDPLKVDQLREMWQKSEQTPSPHYGFDSEVEYLRSLRSIWNSIDSHKLMTLQNVIKFNDNRDNVCSEKDSILISADLNFIPKPSAPDFG
jgi:hypothetical protein